MRGRRRFLVTVIAGASLLLAPTDAIANGGSYLEFDQTHYLSGDAGVATTYVSVPRGKTGLFDRGPFYLFAVPEGTLREGRPIPASAIRLGTFTVEKEKGSSYELRAEFTAPEITSGSYFMGLCDDPCTTAGFREPLFGSISIVATRREGELLTRLGTLQGKLFGVKREARRAERRLERVREELATQLTFGGSERERMSAQIERLETKLAAAQAEPSGRTPFDPWVVGAILLVTLVAAVLAVRRRRMVPAITDL